MIIIETPAPPTRERLVLVPLHSVSREANDPSTEPFTVHTNDARDATPDDLERGGYVPVERAEKAEWSARVARMALANEHQDREGVRIRKDLGTQDAPCPCDTDPEQGMGMHSPPCPLHEAARALRRKTSWEDAAHTMNGELKAAITRAEKAERELEVAMRERNDAIEASSVALSAKSKAERERDEEKRHAGDAADALARLMRERDTLRAEVARLTAPGEGSEGEPTGEALVERFCERPTPLEDDARDIYRLGVAHERARHAAPVSSTPVTSDRATDEELVKVGREAWNRNIGDDDSITAALRATTLAVAARVRQERCLVAQAVGMGVRYMAIFLEMGGRWGVVVGERVASAQAPSEVPTTLARLLGEVSRG